MGHRESRRRAMRYIGAVALLAIAATTTITWSTRRTGLSTDRACNAAYDFARLTSGLRDVSDLAVLRYEARLLGEAAGGDLLPLPTEPDRLPDEFAFLADGQIESDYLEALLQVAAFDRHLCG